MIATLFITIGSGPTLYTSFALIGIGLTGIPQTVGMFTYNLQSECLSSNKLVGKYTMLPRIVLDKY